MKRFLDESNDESILDAVMKLDKSSQATDDTNTAEANIARDAEKQTKKRGKGVASLTYIHLMRRLENHPFLAEDFLRKHWDEDLSKCIDDALAELSADPNPNNIMDIYRLRRTMAEKHQPQNAELTGDDQDSGVIESECFEPDDGTGMGHGQFYFAQPGKIVNDVPHDARVLTVHRRTCFQMLPVSTKWLSYLATYANAIKDSNGTSLSGES